MFILHSLLQLPQHAVRYIAAAPSNLRGLSAPSLFCQPDFAPTNPNLQQPPGPTLSFPLQPPLHHRPLQLLTVPQRESATLMDATDGPFPWSSQPWRSVCLAGSEARPPHEMHVVTGNKRKAPIPTNSHHSPTTPNHPPFSSHNRGGGVCRVSSLGG